MNYKNTKIKGKGATGKAWGQVLRTQFYQRFLNSR